MARPQGSFETSDIEFGADYRLIRATICLHIQEAKVQEISVCMQGIKRELSTTELNICFSFNGI